MANLLMLRGLYSTDLIVSTQNTRLLAFSRHNLSDPSCGILHVCSTQKIFQVSRFRAAIAFLELLLRPESHTDYVESETVDVHEPPPIFRSSPSTLSRSRVAKG